MAVNMALVNQATLDIKGKLQKFEGFEGKNLSELLAIATKVSTQGYPQGKTNQGTGQNFVS